MRNAMIILHTSSSWLYEGFFGGIGNPPWDGPMQAVGRFAALHCTVLYSIASEINPFVPLI